ncbi:MAG: hypothetical protein AB4352_06185 [Hormoscilla sp.]
MKVDSIQELTETFEGHVQQTENGVEYWLARDLQHLLGYRAWRNFEGVIKRVIGIIKHQQLNGKIEKIVSIAKIGSGASRNIVNYKLDREAVSILQQLCSSYKLNNYFPIRNETVVIQLVEKYCHLNEIGFQYQFRLDKYLFDCLVGEKILIEFDEPHHQSSNQQKKIDKRKEEIAMQHNLIVFRVTLDMDIIDLVVFIERTLKSHKTV